MPITIGSNIYSLKAQRGLTRATDELSASSERLSSGLRINRASDDAAGLAISSSLKLDTRVFSQGLRNLNDAVSLLNVADGTVGQLSEIVTRMRELAVQAANGTYAINQRRSVHQESDALVREFNRLTQSTRFNGINILDGGGNTTTAQAGYGVQAVYSAASGTGLSRRRATDFGNVTALASAEPESAVSVSADFNKDGYSDLFVMNTTSVTGSIRINTGQNTFTTSQFDTGMAGAITDAATADVNNDGNIDVVLASSIGIFVLTGTGSGTFNAEKSYAITRSFTSLVVGDFTGDGVADVAAATGGSSLYVLQGNSNGTLRVERASALAGATSRIRAGDVNGDGSTEIVALVGTQVETLGIGSAGQASRIGLINLGGSFNDIAVGDFNRDGYLDFEGVDTNGSSIFLGNGNGTFTNRGSFSDGAFGGSINTSVFDFNSDGNLDIVSGGLFVDGTTYYSLLIGNGDGSFQAAKTSLGVTQNFSNSNLSFGDFNRDGVIDVASGAGSGTVDIVSSEFESVTTMQYLNLNTRADALASLGTIEATFERVTREQGLLGALQSRIASGLRTLRNSRDNYFAADSRISDVDVASESAQFAQSQIRQQVATGILAQANLIPSLAIKLLKQE